MSESKHPSSKRYAAIDVGSNAVRLLIKELEWKPGQAAHEKVVAYYRVPLRLGSKVFNSGELSGSVVEHLSQVMLAFKLLMDVHGVARFRTCATSALRMAENRDAVIHRVLEVSGIEIELITGKEEADLILSNFANNQWSEEANLLCVDVGGGSTELSVMKHGSCAARKSFKLGAVRMLNDAVDSNEWKRIKKFIDKEVEQKGLTIVGTGGNINRYHKVARIKKNKPLSLAILEKWIERIKKVPVQERSQAFGFKHNRSDVIVPAGIIYRSVMGLVAAKEIYVPKVGLSDGIILQLAEVDR
ncbi:MAG: exopolyphosphatase [Flavobacteriales bacterium]|jgi:exopolyphosphatase/guanosine-5'-triphosphate,3'-diphosphate pyrophosphatase|nr:exopolyphosphatase [Flavobacteriales bacterium]